MIKIILSDSDAVSMFKNGGVMQGYYTADNVEGSPRANFTITAIEDPYAANADIATFIGYIVGKTFTGNDRDMLNIGRLQYYDGTTVNSDGTVISGPGHTGGTGSTGDTSGTGGTGGSGAEPGPFPDSDYSIETQISTLTTIVHGLGRVPIVKVLDINGVDLTDIIPPLQIIYTTSNAFTVYAQNYNQLFTVSCWIPDYVRIASTPEQSVVVNHNLGRNPPLITAATNSNIMVRGFNITYTDENSLVLTFLGPFTGYILVR